MTDITDQIAVIERRVASALSRAGRPADDVLILAVSKGQPDAAIGTAVAAGMRHFGENYLDEALTKMQENPDPEISWHFIGRIQSNKTRAIAEHFAWVHTIDRLRVARRLSEQRPAALPPLNVLIQVNLAGEAQKGGVRPEELGELAAAIDELPRLRLRGLMAIPPAGLTPAESAGYFRRIAGLQRQLDSESRHLDVLSLGMSEDFEIAIECGSTCVRIGSALFGPRRTRAI